MPRNSRKRRTKTRKQKVINMIGCSKKHNHTKTCKHKHTMHLGCPNCGPNCHCGPQCNCPHPCSGTCYLNRNISKEHQKQKQKGGSGCGPCGCPIGGLNYQGIKPFMNQTQKGGDPIPGPFVGSAWGSNINEWPGIDGVGGNRNYLSPTNVGVNPQLQMTDTASGYTTRNSAVGGSKSKKRRSRSMKAGGLIPQDLVNLGNNFTFNLQSAYNSLNGYNAPPNPLPYQDQIVKYK